MKLNPSSQDRGTGQGGPVPTLIARELALWHGNQRKEVCLLQRFWGPLCHFCLRSYYILFLYIRNNITTHPLWMERIFNMTYSFDSSCFITLSAVESTAEPRRLTYNWMILAWAIKLFCVWALVMLVLNSGAPLMANAHTQNSLGTQAKMIHFGRTGNSGLKCQKRDDS